MRFFMPLPDVPEHDHEHTYCEWARCYGVPVPPPHLRISRLSFMNPGRLLVAEVGKPLVANWSVVAAIYPGPPVIVACSERHEHSFVVPAECVKDMEFFDPEELPVASE